MRTATLFLLAVLGGCRDLPDGSDPWPFGDAEAQAALDADYPLVMRASPEITNYAPPDWPLEPGEAVTFGERRRLDEEYGSLWGTAVVWVLGGSGVALPFVAGFDRGPPRGSTGPLMDTYVGHIPARLDHYGPGSLFLYSYSPSDPGYWSSYSVSELESELPASLRTVVDVRDHVPSEAEWREFRRRVKMASGGLREVLETERKRYYGAGASW